MKSAALFVAAVLLAGCAKNIDTPDAVKQGVIKDIAKKVDIQNMDVSVESVSFRGKEATARIGFRPKGGDPRQSIMMSYTMERQGDEWHVKGRNMQRHEESTPGAPLSPGTPLPPGHPGVATPGTPLAPGAALPPGHPVVP
jgi:hypothetical protein